MPCTGGPGEKNISAICSVLRGLVFNKNGNDLCFSSLGTKMRLKEGLFEHRESPTERDRWPLRKASSWAGIKDPSGRTLSWRAWRTTAWLTHQNRKLSLGKMATPRMPKPQRSAEALTTLGTTFLLLGACGGCTPSACQGVTEVVEQNNRRP